MNGALTINVDKVRLLATLEANKTAHAAAYAKARAGYLKVSVMSLEDKLSKIIRGETASDYRWSLDAPPEDHTGDYEDVIAMMQWSTSDTIELTQTQFKQYVQDDWGWKDSWVTSNTAYLNA